MDEASAIPLAYLFVKNYGQRRAKHINLTKPPVHKERPRRSSLRPPDSPIALLNEVVHRAVVGHVGPHLVSPHLPLSHKHLFKVYEVSIAALPAIEYTLTNLNISFKNRTT